MPVPQRKPVPGRPPSLDRRTALQTGNVREGTPPVLSVPSVRPRPYAMQTGNVREGTPPVLAVPSVRRRPVAHAASPVAGPIGSRLAAALGYAPASELTPLTAQASQLQGQIASLSSTNAALLAQAQSLEAQIAAAQAQLASLQGQQSALSSQLQSLQAEVASLTSKLSSLQAQLASLQGQYGNLTSSQASLQSEIQALQGKIATDTATVAQLQAQWQGLQQSLAQDASLISQLRSGLASVQSQVKAYGGVSASPALTSGPNDTDEDTPNGPYAAQYGIAGPFDPAFSGFAPYTASFGTGAISLATGAAPSAHAMPRFQSSGGVAIGRSLLGALGYVPASEVSTEDQQIAALQGQLGPLQTQNQQLTARVASDQSTLSNLSGEVAAAQQSVKGLQNQIAGANAQVASLNGQVSSTSSAISTVQGQIASLTSTVQGLGSQVTSLNSTLSGLASQVASLRASISGGTTQHGANLQTETQLANETSVWQGYLADIKQGNYPVSVSWSFGDGTSGSGRGPTHTYGIGSFSPTLTVSVVRPDGATVTHTFALPGILVGQWPASIGQVVANNQVTFRVLDASGNPIPNCRLLNVFKNALEAPVGHQVNTTNSAGEVVIPYGGGFFGISCGYVDGRVLRNPAQYATTGYICG